jgi:hypothetical protein
MSGEIEAKLVNGLGNGIGRNIQPRRIVGEFPEWRWDDNSCHSM